MNPLQEKIAQLRAKNEAARRADLLHQIGYFNESSCWWFAEASNAESRREAAPCRQAALETAAAAHLSALTLIIHEENPLEQA